MVAENVDEVMRFTKSAIHIYIYTYRAFLQMKSLKIKGKFVRRSFSFFLFKKTLEEKEAKSMKHGVWSNL